MQRRARDPDRQARGRARDRAAVHRDAGQLRAHAEPPRLLARAAAAELSLARPRRRHTVHGVGKIGDIFAGCDIDESHPTKSNIDGIQQTEKLLQRARRGLHLHEPRRDGHRSGATATTRSTSTAACRISTAACPDLLEALRPGDLLVITSDHGCDPTTPSTDHSREHAMLLAYVAGPQRRGPDPRGRVRRRRRDGERVARSGKAPSRGIPGQPILAP